MKRGGRSLLLLAVLLCISASCASPGLETQAPPESDALVMYLPPDDFISGAVRKALELYRAAFPQVTVTVQTWERGSRQPYTVTTEAQRQYRQILQTELSAGRGPDLVLFTDADFPDVTKLLQADHFYNLDRFLEADASFDASAYQQAVFDSGLYQGQRLYLPLNYTRYTLLTTPESLEAFGCVLTDETTFQQWAEFIAGYIQTHTPQENRALWVRDTMPEPLLFVNACGLSIVDESGNASLAESEAFRQYMDFYRAIYPDLIRGYEGIAGTTSEDAVAAAVADRQLLSYVGSVQQEIPLYLHYRLRLKGAETVLLRDLPVLEDVDPFVTAVHMAAIRSASPNKANAYEFLKLLLLPSVQKELYGYFPLSNEALWDKLRANGQGLSFAEDELAAMYRQIVQRACRRPNAAVVVEMTRQAMQPWVDGQKTYADCLAELQNQLALYVYE